MFVDFVRQEIDAHWLAGYVVFCDDEFSVEDCIYSLSHDIELEIGTLLYFCDIRNDGSATMMIMEEGSEWEGGMIVVPPHLFGKYSSLLDLMPAAMVDSSQEAAVQFIGDGPLVRAMDWPQAFACPCWPYLLGIESLENNRPQAEHQARVIEPCFVISTIWLIMFASSLEEARCVHRLIRSFPTCFQLKGDLVGWWPDNAEMEQDYINVYLCEPQTTTHICTCLRPCGFFVFRGNANEAMIVNIVIIRHTMADSLQGVAERPV